MCYDKFEDILATMCVKVNSGSSLRYRENGKPLQKEMEDVNLLGCFLDSPKSHQN